MASSDICKLWATPLPLRGGGMLPSRILPGPMDGVTEGSFLAAMTARGYVRCWHAPFIRISTGIPRQARINDHLEPYMNQRLPVIAQMMGTNTDFMDREDAGRHPRSRRRTAFQRQAADRFRQSRRISANRRGRPPRQTRHRVPALSDYPRNVPLRP